MPLCIIMICLFLCISTCPCDIFAFLFLFIGAAKQRIKPKSELRQWKEITAGNMNVWLAHFILMGVKKAKHESLLDPDSWTEYSLLWPEHVYINRFQSIIHFWHLVDNAKVVNKFQLQPDVDKAAMKARQAETKKRIKELYQARKDKGKFLFWGQL